MMAIRRWFEGLGLGQYAEAFEAEEIEIGDLRDLERVGGGIGLGRGERAAGGEALFDEAK